MKALAIRGTAALLAAMVTVIGLKGIAALARVGVDPALAVVTLPLVEVTATRAEREELLVVGTGTIVGPL